MEPYWRVLLMVCVILGSAQGISGASKSRKLLRNPSLIPEPSAIRHASSLLERRPDFIWQRHPRRALQQNDRGPVFSTFQKNGAVAKALNIDRGGIRKQRIEDVVQGKRREATAEDDVEERSTVKRLFPQEATLENVIPSAIIHDVPDTRPFVTTEFIAALNDRGRDAEEGGESDMGGMETDGVKRHRDADIGIGETSEDEENYVKEIETCDPTEPCPSATHVRRVFARSCGGFSGMFCILSVFSSTTYICL